MNKETKDYLKNKKDMEYNISLEKELTKEISSKLKKHFPDTSIEVVFSKFKNGVGILKTYFDGPDRSADAFLRGFPQNGAFMPMGIKIVYNDNGNKGVVEFKKVNDTFKPKDELAWKKFMNLGYEYKESDLLKAINNGINTYIKKAVHNKYGKDSRIEARSKKSGLYYEDYFPY